MIPPAPFDTKAAAARLAFFFALWLTIAGWTAKDVPVGLAAAAGAVWISLKFLPPGDARFRPVQLIALAARFLSASLIAGFDVARRALAKRPDLDPGFVSCPIGLPSGAARDAFLLLQSLQPGTLPTGVEGGSALVHALDVSQPVAAAFAAEEGHFRKAFGHE
ncbi:Na+/H+ antiporter subunit E [Rhodoblastus sp.]|uniref:Na+/H+ antiporter subunit E n=1 Tax=Rhodoblastus sp. TaxID=1962975 RepID=UPI0026262967|nr:Na+/H+ antiporter subunit E [Rhodoblastus sp.]